MSVQTGQVQNITRMAQRESKLPNLARQAQHAIVLHRTAVMRTASRTPVRRPLGIEDHRFYAKTIQQKRKHDSNGATAHNGDRSLQHHAGHTASASIKVCKPLVGTTRVSRSFAAVRISRYSETVRSRPRSSVSMVRSMKGAKAGWFGAFNKSSMMTTFPPGLIALRQFSRILIASSSA